MSKLKGESSGLSEAEAYASVKVTWSFILIPLCLWKADEVEK